MESTHVLFLFVSIAGQGETAGSNSQEVLHNLAQHDGKKRGRGVSPTCVQNSFSRMML